MIIRKLLKSKFIMYLIGHWLYEVNYFLSAAEARRVAVVAMYNSDGSDSIVSPRKYSGNGSRGDTGLEWYVDRKHPVLQMNQLASSSNLAINETSLETKKIGNNVVTTAVNTTTAATSTAGGNGKSARRDYLKNKKARKRKRKKLAKSKQPFCLKATVENFSTFCAQTSLHGWQYIAQKHTSTPKHIFWAVIVSMSMATAALFLYYNTVDYFNATVSLSEIFFMPDPQETAMLCLNA